MKNVKIIIIFFSLFLLTGCTVKYNLTINSDKTITETITGTVLNTELDNGDNTDLNTYMYAFDIALPLIDGEDTFDKEIVDTEKGKNFTFTYNYKGNYSKSSVLNKCFENYEYKETEDEYIFKLSGKFNCFLANKIEINLISAYGVLENNADKSWNNKYTWIIKNPDDVDIEAVVSKKILYSNKEDDNLLSTFRIVGLCIFAALFIGAMYIYKRRKIIEK